MCPQRMNPVTLAHPLTFSLVSSAGQNFHPSSLFTFTAEKDRHLLEEMFIDDS